jgi:glycosyltransferase involved in cell wall biosynthesis
MPSDKIVLVSSVIDQGDILGDFLQWYLDIGVDFILVQEFGSTDNSHDVLRSFADDGRVAWFPLPERNMQKYDPGLALASVARDRHDADWIIYCDADEFLCADGDLRTILRDAANNDCSVVSVPRLNMTGSVLRPGQSAPGSLTLRIDRPVPVRPEFMSMDELPVPHIFTKHPPKTIVRAKALVSYGPGTHTAAASWGRNGEVDGLRFLHFPVRGFDKFEKKIQNTVAWLDDNPHLHPTWAWHWRRFIRYYRSGRLREEYENQFLSPARAQELVGNGTCTIDDTVARWVCRRL